MWWSVGRSIPDSGSRSWFCCCGWCKVRDEMSWDIQTSRLFTWYFTYSCDFMFTRRLHSGHNNYMVLSNPHHPYRSFIIFIGHGNGFAAVFGHWCEGEGTNSVCDVVNIHKICMCANFNLLRADSQPASPATDDHTGGVKRLTNSNLRPHSKKTRLQIFWHIFTPSAIVFLLSYGKEGW